MTEKRKSHARKEFLPLEKPNPSGGPSRQERENWLNTTCKGFVSPSAANKEYYRVVLETLWPPNHGLPGPYVLEVELRTAIDNYRSKRHTGTEPYKNYIDVFRRVRELQGEEGVTGIARQGQRFQLVDLELSMKRTPRTKLNESDWERLLAAHNKKCPVCGRLYGTIKFDQDHKVPRLKGGGDELTNWQPLCGECNNFKSTACRGCELDCQNCPWAFPERHSLIKIGNDDANRIREYARKLGISPSDLMKKIVAYFFENKR